MEAQKLEGILYLAILDVNFDRKFRSRMLDGLKQNLD